LSLSRNTGYNLAGALLPLALSLVTVPLYLRLVGVERYGVLQIAWLLLGYFGLFDLGLGRATAYRLAALRDAPASVRATVFWSALVVNVAMGLVGGAVLWAVAGHFLVGGAKVSLTLRAEMTAAVPYLALAVPIATMNGVLTGALQARERFLDTNMVSICSTAMFQLLPLAVAAQGTVYLPSLLLAAITARGCALAWLAQKCAQEFTRGQAIAINRAEMRDLLSYGGWVTLSAVFGPMLVIADRFAMSAVLGMAAVAVYSIPYNMASRIAVLPASLTNALFPKLAGTNLGSERVMGRAATRMLISLISPPVLIAILVAAPLLKLWVGAKLAGAAAPVARVLIIAFWFNALGLVAFTRLQARGRPDLVTKILLVQIPPYWALLYVAMPAFGLMGCAIVFLARLIGDYLLQSWVNDGAVLDWQRASAFATLMFAALWVAPYLEVLDPHWLVGVGVLIGSTLALSWHSIGPEIVDSVRQRRARHAVLPT